MVVCLVGPIVVILFKETIDDLFLCFIVNNVIIL